MRQDLPRPGRPGAFRNWWLAWGGHIYTWLAIILMLVAFWCISVIITSTDPQVMFYSFVVAVLCFLIAVCLGILGSHKLQTRIQRRYIIKTDERLERLEPPGRDRNVQGSTYGSPRYSPVPDAHSPEREDSDA